MATTMGTPAACVWARGRTWPCGDVGLGARTGGDTRAAGSAAGAGEGKWNRPFHSHPSLLLERPLPFPRWTLCAVCRAAPGTARQPRCAGLIMPYTIHSRPNHTYRGHHHHHPPAGLPTPRTRIGVPPPTPPLPRRSPLPRRRCPPAPPPPPPAAPRRSPPPTCACATASRVCGLTPSSAATMMMAMSVTWGGLYS